MDILFSFEQKAFLATGLRAAYEAAGTWPTDAVEVSQEGERILREAIACGHAIEQESSGKWDIAISPSFPALASSCLDDVRTARDAILNRLAGIGFAALASGNALTVQAIASARASLLDITTCPNVVSAQALPALQAAIGDELQRIASALPNEAQRAFLDAGISFPMSLPASGKD